MYSNYLFISIIPSIGNLIVFLSEESCFSQKIYDKVLITSTTKRNAFCVFLFISVYEKLCLRQYYFACGYILPRFAGLQNIFKKLK